MKPGCRPGVFGKDSKIAKFLARPMNSTGWSNSSHLALDERSRKRYPAKNDQSYKIPSFMCNSKIWYINSIFFSDYGAKNELTLLR